LTTLLYILFILSSIVLIVSILLQPGKADAGALFSSSISSTAFGPRGTQTILAKLTIGAAALFMLVAIALSLPVITGQRSAVQNSTAEETQPPSSPAPAASPATSPAQGAVNTDATQNTTTVPAQTAPAASPANSANPGTPPAPSK
jgi:preprotein translocase subunit SecG